EKSGLDLTTYDGAMKGTKHGPLLIPRDPDSTNLVWLLDWRGSPEVRMPHGKKKLSTVDRNAIRAWIREGAKIIVRLRPRTIKKEPSASAPRGRGPMPT